MSYVLVCANDSACRRLHVDNLVLRGYVAVGTASIEEANRLLHRETPYLILVCCVEEGQDADIVALRRFTALDDVPVVIVSPEPPESEWMQRWGVVHYIHYPSDFRKLVQMLQPWLTPPATVIMPFRSSTHPLEMKDVAA